MGFHEEVCEGKMKKEIFILFVVFMLPSGIVAEDSPTASLSVSISGLRSSRGQVCVALFNSDRGFPAERKNAYRESCGRVENKKSFVKFQNIPQGEYAAFAFHDEDSDRKLKSNWIGMPKEGVGASRNAKGVMGPPSWDDAKFAISGPEHRIAIKLTYL